MPKWSPSNEVNSNAYDSPAHNLQFLVYDYAHFLRKTFPEDVNINLLRFIWILWYHYFILLHCKKLWWELISRLQHDYIDAKSKTPAQQLYCETKGWDLFIYLLFIYLSVTKCNKYIYSETRISRISVKLV